MRWRTAHRITEPTREDIRAYVVEIKETYSPSTVNLYITALRLFFQWLESEGLYADITKHVKGVRIDKGHKRDALTARQVKQVLQAAKGDDLKSLRDYALLALLFTGGLRTVEIRRADIGDLRPRGNSTVLYIQGKGRTSKVDYIKIVPAVEDALRAYLMARGETSSSAPLFASISNNNKGGRLTTVAISGAVKAAFRRVGLDSDRLTAHSTRHTAVTLGLLSGQSLEEVKQFARHQSLETTLIYAHNLERDANETESKIADSIFDF